MDVGNGFNDKLKGSTEILRWREKEWRKRL